MNKPSFSYAESFKHRDSIESYLNYYETYDKNSLDSHHEISNTVAARINDLELICQRDGVPTQDLSPIIRTMFGYIRLVFKMNCPTIMKYEIGFDIATKSRMPCSMEIEHLDVTPDCRRSRERMENFVTCMAEGDDDCRRRVGRVPDAYLQPAVLQYINGDNPSYFVERLRKKLLEYDTMRPCKPIVRRQLE